jgi:hypothetical protein
LAKLSLTSLLGGLFSRSALNTNFSKILTELNDKVLYRDNPSGEPNSMSNELDMNSQRVINLPTPVGDNDPARWIDVKNGVSGVTEPIPSQTGNTDKALSTTGSALTFKDGDVLAYTHSDTGGDRRTIGAKLEEVVSALDFGAVGDGVTNDNTAFTNIEASADTDNVDLRGLTYLTTHSVSTFTKNYFNGDIIYTNAQSKESYLKTASEYSDYDITVSGSKCSELDWEGKDVLWLGTSIPAFGTVAEPTYPQMASNVLGFTLVNNSFAGSHATYDSSLNGVDASSIRCLSMTEDDRAAGEAANPGSYYQDGVGGEYASQQTCDYRIGNEFADVAFDVVVLDHNHNDRWDERGLIDGTSYTLSGITKGGTTTVTVSDATGLSVGDSIYLSDNVGIANLNYAAARIQSISTNDLTLNIDSSGYSGTFTSGTATLVDKTTVYGSWNFLIAFIKNQSIINGAGDVKIILSSAPSEFTSGSTSSEIWSNARAIEAVANKWSIGFYDVAQDYGVKEDDHILYFPDNVHPSTVPARQALANYWTTWLSGGRGETLNPDDYLAAPGTPSNTHNREPLYSRYDNSYDTRETIYGDDVSLFTEDFTTFPGTWTRSGTNLPVQVTAPWDAGAKAVFFEGIVASGSEMYESYALGDNFTFDFEFYLPTTVGVVASGSKSIRMCRLQVPQAAYEIGLVCTPAWTRLQVDYFTGPGTGLTRAYRVPDDLTAATLYKAKIEVIQGTATTDGRILISLDGVELFSAPCDNDGQSAVSQVTFGVDSAVALDYDLYIGDVNGWTKTASDYSARLDEVVNINGKQLNVVNGVTTGTVSIQEILTVATGSITPTKPHLVVDTEASAATDDLDTIDVTNLVTGTEILLRPLSGARTVVIKHNTGNVFLDASTDFSLDNARDIWKGVVIGSNVYEISRSNNG